jgi:peptidoglycan/LPS O-acetylase OafA/YrhL
MGVLVRVRKEKLLGGMVLLFLALILSYFVLCVFGGHFDGTNSVRFRLLAYRLWCFCLGYLNVFVLLVFI